MNEYKNEDHNEAVEVETRLIDAIEAVEKLQNYLYERNSSHPLIEYLNSIIFSIENVPWDDYYEKKQQEVGEDDWWEEA